MKAVINYIPIMDDPTEIDRFQVGRWVTTRFAYVLEAMEESSNIKVIIHSSLQDNLIQYEKEIIEKRGGEVEICYK